MPVEEEEQGIKETEQNETQEKGKSKSQKNILHFTGPEPTAIDLAKVEGIRRKGKTIFFDCCTRTYPVDMADEAAAETLFPNLLNMWGNGNGE
jgi:hypothetical protein